MALALEARAMKDDVMLGDTPKALKRRRKMRDVETRGRLWKHATLRDLDGLVSPEELPGLFTFTLVRNPWDRAVSYYHWLRGQRFDHSAVTLAKAADFEGFLKDPGTQAAFRDWPARRYMTDASGQEQARAYIRIEHFEEDAAPLMAHLGFELRLGRANASARGPYPQHFKPETAQIIADCCAEDISRFGYSF